MLKISVITVSYNSSKTIEETIKSVLNQTYKDFEYIIIDGGSTDGTLDIIKRYESFFKGKLKWISEKDKGIYDAMNKGINMANGDIISLLNSDDIFFDNKVLENVLNVFIKSGADVVFSDVWYFNNDPSKIIRKWQGKPGKIFLGWIPGHPGVFVKKSVYESEGKYDINFQIAADYDFLLRIFKDNNISKVYYPNCTVLMRLGGTSTGNFKNILKGNKEVILALKKNKIKFYMLAYIGRLLRRFFQFIKK